MTEPYKDWSRHFGDLLRYPALTEDQMTNEDEQPMPEQEEVNGNVY
jgi:hypothetical protein